MRFWFPFLLGLSLGVLLALLLTPQPGAQIRRALLSQWQQRSPWARHRQEAA